MRPTSFELLLRPSLNTHTLVNTDKHRHVNWAGSPGGVNTSSFLWAELSYKSYIEVAE